jgi:iron complex outermembrane receptor protein
MEPTTNMLLRRSPALICIMLLVALPARGQRDTTDVAFQVRMPDSVVVTASRMASAAQETGRRVAVYTQRDIEALSVNTVDQLLDVVAGLDVQSRGGFGVQSDLTMRGSTFNGVVLLLDGARLNDPMTGHFLMDIPVPLSEIARVEVLRGPATALHGPDALGGVVHLITKTALRQDRTGSTGLAARVDGRYGKHNLYDIGGAVRNVGRRTAVSAAAEVQGSDGQIVQNDAGNPLSNGRGGNVRTDFVRGSGTAAVANTLGDATVYTRVGVDDREFSAWHFYTPFPSDKAREHTSTFWIQSRVQSAPGADTPWRVQVSGKQHRDRYTFNAETPAAKHTSRMLNLQGQASHTVGLIRMTGGLSAQVRGIDSNGLGLHTNGRVGPFVNLRWHATPRLTVNQSTRVNYDPLYGVEPTPQLFLAYELGWTTLRAGGGRAVRAPNYVERFLDAGGNRGTSTLDAEKAWSGEVGADVRLPADLRLHLTGFGRTTRGLIDYALETPDAKVFVARNLHRVETLGIETEASLDRQIGGVGVHLDAAYTFLDASFEAQEQVADFKYALTSARHHLQGSASISAGSVTIGVQGLWKDRLEDTGLAMDRHGVVHTRVAYEARLGDRTVTLSTEVRNLFDTDYSEVFDAPLPGRTLLVGISAQL